MVGLLIGSDVDCSNLCVLQSYIVQIHFSFCLYEQQILVFCDSKLFDYPMLIGYDHTAFFLIAQVNFKNGPVLLRSQNVVVVFQQQSVVAGKHVVSGNIHLFAEEVYGVQVLVGRQH